ncbi:MAG: peptidoglycan-binding domain-containing protein, partial [Clostridia bacterium]
MRKGYTGADVTSVQTRLKDLGYYSGALDGVYGTGSIAAVKAFQQKNSLTA